MASERAWIESRHLRESADGEAALAALDSLPSALAERVLQRGDAIAVQSMSLAHTYLPCAVRAAQGGPETFAHWEATLLEAAGGDALPRELAIAFFRIEPLGLGAWTDGVRREWLACVHALADASRRLATAFVEATAAILGDGRALDEDTLVAWHRAAARLLALGGWRAEFLAESFLGSSAGLVGCADAAVFDDWAELVSILGTSGRNPKPPLLPEALRPGALRPLDAAAIASAIRLAATAARHSNPKAAQRLLELAPAAVIHLSPEHATALLACCELCPAFDPLADSMALLGGVLHGVPAESLPFLLQQMQRVADSAPSVLPAFLRTMDRAIEEGGPAGVEVWVTRGLELADAGAVNGGAADAAAAHFRLETRTSHKLLVHRSAAVAFEEVDGMLRRYLTMMSRRSFQLMPSPGVWMRPPLVAPEDVAIRLPERVDLFESSEDNQALYKVVATHIAGRFEYGTYDFDLGELAARGWTPPSLPEQEEELENGPRDILAFLACFPNPLLASSLFVLLEGVRVDARLARDFPGLRRELQRMGRLYADTTVPAAQDRYDERLLETLFHMGLAQRSVAELEPRLRGQGEFLSASVELLRSPEATVYDSAALTIAYYGGLAFAAARALDESDEVAFVEMGGATIVDPFEHLDDSVRRENTAPWRPDPTKAEPTAPPPT